MATFHQNRFGRKLICVWRSASLVISLNRVRESQQNTDANRFTFVYDSNYIINCHKRRHKLMLLLWKNRKIHTLERTKKTFCDKINNGIGVNRTKQIIMYPKRSFSCNNRENQNQNYIYKNNKELFKESKLLSACCTMLFRLFFLSKNKKRREKSTFSSESKVWFRKRKIIKERKIMKWLRMPKKWESTEIPLLKREISIDWNSSWDERKREKWEE